MPWKWKYPVALFLIAAGTAAAQVSSDPLLSAARDAFQRKDRPRLAQLVEQAASHPLRPWVDYWNQTLRLNEARPEDFNAFAQRWPGSYVEDRLRNDWLLELGARADWASFATEYPRFRMDDDREVNCHALAAERALGRPLKDAEAKPFKERALAAWLIQRDADEGCARLARQLVEAGVFSASDVQRKLLRTVEEARPRAYRQAAELAKDRSLGEAWDQPQKLLLKKSGSPLARAVAHARLASSDFERSAELLRSRPSLPPTLRLWAWLQISRHAALRQRPDAHEFLREALAVKGAEPEWSDDGLAWAARAALRASDWKRLHDLLDPLPAGLQRDPAWPYWRAQAAYRSAPEGSAGDAQRREARAALQQQASPLHFYGKLAADELGLKLPLPTVPAALTKDEREAAARHPGLQRALLLIQIGLRSEGVREWNFSLRDLRGDRELMAAAQLACEAQVWDRCINTSERTQLQVDLAQRYPTPFREQVMAQARAAGLDPADPYGLMRQESRFITDARSHVGASGLMQVMPATARYTAKKIGLAYSPAALQDMDVNLRIGMAYLRMVLDDFDGELALAAAAYNAGPGRPRRWREGAPLDAAAWVETIPFNETRDYVKKVLSGATVYARLLGSPDAKLRHRLGQLVGPRNGKPINEELP